MDDAAALSRGTMLTDRWRALNADLFDMKLQVKINEPNHSNTISNRIGVLQHINKSATDVNEEKKTKDS